MRMFLGFWEPVRRILPFDRLEMRLSYEEPLRRVIWAARQRSPTRSFPLPEGRGQRTGTSWFLETCPARPPLDRLEVRLSYEESLRRVIPPFRSLRDLTFFLRQFFQAFLRLSGQAFAFVRVEAQGIEPIPIVQAQ